jgi:hypothetical protein
MDGRRNIPLNTRTAFLYHWRMNGSYSLKSILPVLVPEMTYEGMKISDVAMVSGGASTR